MMRPLEVLLLLGALLCCGRPPAEVTRLEGLTMGTTYSVELVELPAGLDPRELHAALHARLCALDGAMSTYDADSELSRFNAAGADVWFPVGADTLFVVEQALRIADLTGGAFDVTVGPLVELWGFGPGGAAAAAGAAGAAGAGAGAGTGATPERPEAAAIDALRASVGSSQLATRASPPALAKLVAGLRVDLSAIAKGFAVDELARLLEERGLRHYLVEVGGELRGRGHNAAGEPWRVAVERPPGGAELPACLLPLARGAVATSGDYRQGFERDGQRYTHVLDPRTGWPVTQGVVSATVLAATALEADAFATALMVLPPDEGLRLAAREGLAALLVLRADGGLTERRTPDFPGHAP